MSIEEVTSKPIHAQMPATGKYDLRKLAGAQRLVMAAFLSLFILPIAGFLIHPILGLVLYFAVLGFQIYSIGYLAKQIGWSSWLAILGLFIPLLNLIIMLQGSSTATHELRKAGLRVGFLGVSKKQLLQAEEAGII